MKLFALEYNTISDSFNIGYFKCIEAATGERDEYIKYLNKKHSDLSKLKLNGESPDVFACTSEEYLEGKYAWIFIDIVTIDADSVLDSEYNKEVRNENRT